jgi:hypothetical protein
MILRFIILAVALTCSGCFPVRWQDTVHITGAVLDNATQQPIAGAKLQYAHFPRQVIYTDLEGQYDFPTISHRGVVLLLLPIDHFHMAQTLTIDATGYVPTNVLIFGSMDTTNHIDFHLNHE